MSSLPKYEYSLTDTDMRAIIQVFRIFEIRMRSGVMREKVLQQENAVQFSLLHFNVINLKTTFVESDGCNEYARLKSYRMGGLTI